MPQTPIRVFKDRTTVVGFKFPYDLSDSVLTSEIRRGPSDDTPLIATWEIEFTNDGRDGATLFSIDNSVSALIEESYGYMDVKRVVDGEPVPVFDDPLPVEFKRQVTV